ncbi:MAG: hypothetical protein N2316_00760 [Spirochaetes bacterium]|nr:hypothetical protein [Spirochaetota bacterium]
MKSDISRRYRFMEFQRYAGKREKRRAFALLKALLLGILLLLIACNWARDERKLPPRSQIGWISDNEFRVRAAGAAKYKAGDLSERKTQALQAAILMAHYIIYEEFITTIARDVAHIPRSEIKKRVTQELGQHISAGKVIEMEYDGEGNCKLIYEITGENIKQKLYSVRNRMMIENK